MDGSQTIAKRLWITWERHRRSQTLSQRTRSTLIELTSALPRPLKYISLLRKTRVLLRRQEFHILFVQNPSIVLTLFALFYCRRKNLPLVVDAHNAGLFPLEGKYRLLNRIAALIAKYSDITIVTNSYLSEYVDSLGGNPIIMPDPVPPLKPCAPASLAGSSNPVVVFVCSWSRDEPYNEFLLAATSISNAYFYITGKPSEQVRKTIKVPPHIRLTGFLEDAEYVELLAKAHLIVALTLRENSLNCAAYEAVALERPLLLSDTAALREYFGQGAIFTANSPSAIERNIVSALESVSTLEKAQTILKSKLEKEWGHYFSALESSIRERLTPIR